MMPLEKNLSKEDLEEILALPGNILVEDVKRKYGIGAGRLYRIWNNPVESMTQVEPFNPVERVSREDILGDIYVEYGWIYETILRRRKKM